MDGFRVVEISEFKELVVNAHLIRAREHNGSATLRAVLDEFGQLHSIRLEREIVMGGASGTKTYSREYSRVGSTTLREPEWVDRAINRRKRPERRMSGHR